MMARTDRSPSSNWTARKMASRACLAAAVAASSRGGAFVSAFGRSGAAAGVRALSTASGSSLNNRAAAPASAAARASSYGVQLRMSSTEAAAAAPAAATSPRRVKTAEAAVSDEKVSVKGWVRTVRKQKTLAFVEINDGSNMGGIQCVLPFEDVDEDTLKGVSMFPASCSFDLALVGALLKRHDSMSCSRDVFICFQPN